MLHFYCYFFLFVYLNAVEVEEMHQLFNEKLCIPEKYLEDLPIINASETVIEEKNIASRLNELVQLNQIAYSYELLSEEGPSHNKKFVVLLKLGNELYKGVGPSHKSAMRDAAALALEATSYNVPPIKLSSKRDIILSPKSLLNNIAIKLGFSVGYYLVNGKEEKEIDSTGVSDQASYGKSKSVFPKLNSSSSIRIPTEEPQISGPFAVKLKVIDLEFMGIGHTIKSAEHDAAIKALKYLEKNALLRKNVCSNADNWEDCKKQRELLKTPTSRLNEAAQKLGTSFDCKIIDESGKPHKKIFTTQCTLGDRKAEGVGTSKKESKKIAAEKMLNNFFFQTNQFNENTIVKSFATPKKNKQKKKMIIRNSEKNWELEGISNVLTSFWASPDEDENMMTFDDKKKEIKSRSNGGTFKNKLLELGNQVGISIGFMDIGGSDNEASTLVSLGVEPSQICLGTDTTREKAHEKAALHGLKFLYKSGVFDRIQMYKNKEDSIIAKILMQDDNEISYTVIENNAEKQM